MRRLSDCRYAAGVLLLLSVAGCAYLRPAAYHVFHGAQTNSGPEPYASWFGDTDGHIFYFGLSAFWETSKRCAANGGEHCALSDLQEPGDHLIGRFDLDRQRFLPPLLVRRADPRAPSSVWDVLVHTNGRIYYTTMWDEFGSVLPDGSDVRYYPDAGSGLNELWEGPDGEIYATRYLGSVSGAADENGAVVVFGPDGTRRREYPFKKENGVVICPRDVAVNPRTRDIWVNTDMFDADGHPDGHDTFRLSPDGRILERISFPFIAFPSFDAAGRGWFVDDDGKRFSVRIVDPGGHAAWLDLGPHGPINVVQDVKHFGDVTLISTWARNVHVVRALPGERFETFMLTAEPLLGCPDGAALGYTAVLSHKGIVYETVYCGIRVIRVGAVDADPTP